MTLIHRIAPAATLAGFIAANSTGWYFLVSSAAHALGL